MDSAALSVQQPPERAVALASATPQRPGLGKSATWRTLCAMLTGTDTGGATVEERLLAVTRDTAAKIARLSLRQVDYWARTDLVPASIEGTVSSRRRVRLYSFLDVLALTVAAELKQRGVSLQHI